MKELIILMKEGACALKANVSGKMIASGALGSTMLLGSSITAFASPPSTPTVAITEDMLKPIVDGIVANLAVILPIGIAIMGILIGVRLIPTLLGRFTRA